MEWPAKILNRSFKKLLVHVGQSMYRKGTEAAELLEWASDKSIRKCHCVIHRQILRNKVQHVPLRVATAAVNHIRNKFTETQNILGASSTGWYRIWWIDVPQANSLADSESNDSALYEHQQWNPLFPWRFTRRIFQDGIRNYVLFFV